MIYSALYTEDFNLFQPCHKKDLQLVQNNRHQRNDNNKGKTMVDNRITLHTKAVNLARRWTVQNENDLMQEDMYGNNTDIGEKRKYDFLYCSELASHLVNSNRLPEECRKYEIVYSELKRRDSDTTHPTQILS